MRNFRDHLTFIKRCAPEKYRNRHKRMLIRQLLSSLLFRTELGIVVRPIWFSVRYVKIVFQCLARFRKDDVFRLHSFPAVIRWPALIFLAPYSISSDDCLACGLDAEWLAEHGILRPTLASGWYDFELPPWPDPERPAIRRLLIRAWNPLSKPFRFLNLRRDMRRHRSMNQASPGKDLPERRQTESRM